MVDLSKIFDGIEKVAYDILIWMLLVPKTLARILIDPQWVPGYVTKELEEKDEARFDDYLSPVILLLVVSLLPYLYLTFTPYPGVSIGDPVMTTPNEPAGILASAELLATADFISETGEYTYEWTADENESQVWKHGYLNDYVTFQWSTPGWKQISVNATNEKGESLWGYSEVYVPEPLLLPLTGVSAEDLPAAGKTTAGTSAASNLEKPNILEELSGPATFLPALGFLSLPMLFAIATEAFRGKTLMRSTLRRSFYIQCYYFAPAILIAWTFLLGFGYFVVPTDTLMILFLLVVFLAGVIWLLRNEILVIFKERDFNSKWPAFGVVMACLGLVAAALFATGIFVADFESFRMFLQWFYALAGIGIVMGWARTRRKSRQARPSAKATEASAGASE